MWEKLKVIIMHITINYTTTFMVLGAGGARTPPLAAGSNPDG